MFFFKNAFLPSWNEIPSVRVEFNSFHQVAAKAGLPVRNWIKSATF